MWLLTALLWGYDCYLWGGLRDTPVVGQRLMADARTGSPLAATYMFLGSQLNGLIGQTDEARAFAARKFPRLVQQPEQLRYLATAQFLSAQRGLARLFYTLAPVLLVLSFAAHFLRQKRIRSFGARD